MHTRTDHSRRSLGCFDNRACSTTACICILLLHFIHWLSRHARIFARSGHCLLSRTGSLGIRRLVLALVGPTPSPGNTRLFALYLNTALDRQCLGGSFGQRTVVEVDECAIYLSAVQFTLDRVKPLRRPVNLFPGDLRLAATREIFRTSEGFMNGALKIKAVRTSASVHSGKPRNNSVVC